MVTSLKVVATPIGNLRDISLRAIDAITEADVILAEDTRHSGQLIKALGLELKPSCRLISCHAQMEKNRAELVLQMLEARERVILLSDAGCPTISDPGSLLVQAIIEAGFKVEVIPGPSAHSAALMGAGIDTTRFAFLGFLPQKKSARERLIKGAAEVGLAVVIFESPLRVRALLDELYQILGARRVVVARELTKTFESFHRGQLGAPLDPPLFEKGEVVVVVEAHDPPKTAVVDEVEAASYIAALLKEGHPTKEMTSLLMERYGMKKNLAYELILKVKNA